MEIAVFGEPLRVATSATPGRGMLVELLRRRPDDKFIFVFFADPYNSEVLSNFLLKLKPLNNWEIFITPTNKLKNYFKALLGLDIYELNIKADVYLNPDCTSLGRNGHPLIVTIADFSVYKGRNFASFSNPISYLIRKAIVSRGIANADKIVSISKNTFKELIQLFKNKSNCVTVIYNGIDPYWFNVKKKVGHLDPPYWVWWGQITNRKNLEKILTAYSEVLRNHKSVPDFKIIYSNDSVPHHLLDLISKLEITKNVWFIKRMRFLELIEVVSNSSGLVFASKVEGFGVPIIEAMATGIPVLTSNSSSMPEVAGGHAVLCDPFSVSSIVSGMKVLLDGFQNSEDQIQKRREWAGNFTYQKAAEGYDKLITELINEY